MSNYNSLKSTIDANIKQNGNQEITGQILNSVLNAMVTTLGTGYQFAGVVTIATNPGTPDAKVFYIANGKGTYEKFGGLEVTEDDVVVLYWDSAWHKVATGIASQEKLSELETNVGILSNEKNVLSSGTILFTSEDVSVGDVIEYSFISTNSTFGLFDVNGNRIARADFVEGTGNVNGNIEIPEGFSYAQVIWGSISNISIKRRDYTNNGLYNAITSLSNQGVWGKWDDRESSFRIDTSALRFYLPAGVELAIYAGNRSFDLIGEKSCLIFSPESQTSVNYIVYNTQEDTLYPKPYSKGIGEKEVALAVIKTNYATQENKKYSHIAFAGGAIIVDDVMRNSINLIEENIDLIEENIAIRNPLFNDVGAISIGKVIIPLIVGREHSSDDDIFHINIQPNKEFSIEATTDAVFDNFFIKLFFVDGTNKNVFPVLNEKTSFFLEKEVIASSVYVSYVKSATVGVLNLSFDYAQSFQNTIKHLVSEYNAINEDLYGEKIESYIWATTAEHSSSLDLIPVNILQGETFLLTISEQSAVCDNTSIFAKLHFSDGTDKNYNNIILGEPYKIRAPKDIVNISFYIYKITTLGEFRVEIKILGSGLKADIEAIQTFLPDFKAIPYYYNENNYIQGKLDEVVANVADLGANGIPFIFITDTHWLANAQHSPALVNYITQNSSVQDVIFGGDVIDGGENAKQIAAINDFGKKMNAVSPRFFACFGNHDTNLNDGGTGFNSEVYYALVEKYADNIVNWGNLSYFYCDNKICKTRMVFLDTYKGQSGHTDSLNEQISWLNSVLQDCPNDYHIVVFQHSYFHNENNDDLVPIVDAIVTTLDNFNLTGKAKVEAIIAGHMHIDRNATTPGGIPVVLTTCDAAYGQSGYGTINEQAFDVMTIDYVNRIIKCVRIGRGENRTISY